MTCCFWEALLRFCPDTDINETFYTKNGSEPLCVFHAHNNTGIQRKKRGIIKVGSWDAKHPENSGLASSLLSWYTTYISEFRGIKGLDIWKTEEQGGGKGEKQRRLFRLILITYM